MRLIFKGEFTDLNTYINAERTNKFIAAKLKKQETEAIAWNCKQQGLKPYKKKIVEIIFSWYCKNKKKDRDNIAFAKKFILDGLVMAGVLKDDGWDFVGDFADRFYIDPYKPRVEVEII